MLQVVTRTMSALSAALIVVIMLIVSSNILLRQFGYSVPGLVEIVEVLMPASAFLAAAGCQRWGHHVNVDLIIPRLTGGMRRAVGLFAGAVTVGFLAWLTYASATNAMSAWESRESRFGTLLIPVWPTRVIITVGVLVWLLEAINSMRGDPFESEPSPYDGDIGGIKVSV